MPAELCIQCESESVCVPYECALAVEWDESIVERPTGWGATLKLRFITEAASLFFENLFCVYVYNMRAVTLRELQKQHKDCCVVHNIQWVTKLFGIKVSQHQILRQECSFINCLINTRHCSFYYEFHKNEACSKFTLFKISSAAPCCLSCSEINHWEWRNYK